jgi:isoleucyl-tRNA synthetase
LTESLYQGLRPFIPEDPKVVDARSIHFLGLPDIKEEYFDVDIERQVTRMQAVIELTRIIRERHNLSLKVGFILTLSQTVWLTRCFQTPLKELLIFHSDPAYLEDVKPLLRYIQSELNVRDIVFSSDEESTGVRYKATADWGVLGRKLRKDLGKVKNALPDLTSDEVKAYERIGKVSVAGIELVAGDLTVQRYIELPAGAEQQFATHTDADVVVRLDVLVHPELKAEWLARELVNRVQKLRKKAGLQATDDVDVFYTFAGTDGAEVIAAMEEHSAMIERTVHGRPQDGSARPAGKEAVIEEEQEIADVKFMLALVKP